MSLDRDWQIRLAALKAVEDMRLRGNGVVTASELDQGFIFEGRRIALWNPIRGIWRPQELREPGVALSVLTAPRVAGKKPAYDDEVADEDRGYFGYKYEGSDPRTWTNAAVRLAMELGRPIIYLYGITPGVYEVLSPVYVAGEDERTKTFFLQADVAFSATIPQPGHLDRFAPRREYQTVAAKRRVHQHRFRELVLSAYRRRCAICSLAHSTLLDAAHIIPDHDDRGLPLVSNGISMCKIHHSAYDANILGINTDLIVRVRSDILEEIDGPMLEHGLKRMDGITLSVPRSADLRPNREFLAERFEAFRAA